MPSPETLDVKRLAAPIPGPNAAGADLRAEAGPGSLYYRVKDARTAARAAERLALTGDADAPPPDWRPVLQHGVEALAEKSKDLEITAYVVEALVRLHGFAGLRDGFRLTRELIDVFWDGLYPLPDEDGIETRLAPLTGLNGADAEGTLSGPILRVFVTDGADGRLSSAHYQEARALAKTTDAKARERKAAAGATTPEAFQKAVAETPPAFFRTLVEDSDALPGGIRQVMRGPGEALRTRSGAPLLQHPRRAGDLPGCHQGRGAGQTPAGEQW